MAEKKDNQLAHEHTHESLHEDTHEHTHGHVHDPQEKKRQTNRIARIIGHLEHVKKMIDMDKDCAEVLIQLSAVRSALNGLGKEIINEHLAHCITHAIKDGDMDAVKDFEKALQQYL